MENGSDLLEWLGPDASIRVFSYLEHPADLVRATVVSRSWRQFVIANGLSKSLCTKLCPEVSYFSGIKEITPPGTVQLDESNSTTEWRNHERDHKIYTYINSFLVSTEGATSCISYCIGASSTDHFPEESIENTLKPTEEADWGSSYWSSVGEVDPAVPESLMYMLNNDLAFVDEIMIRPLQEIFEIRDYIYSSKFVRFKLGHSKLPITPAVFNLQQSHQIADENYVWTYISPQYPMEEKNVLQSFKLPRPVLCIGAVVKVELLGRVLKHDFDDLFYICICDVQVRGRTLLPLLAADFSETVHGHGGGVLLKYNPMGYVESDQKWRPN
ncbi:F-box protein [Rhynchospora pubera]|uniref:F-box protein n=1 Tax=Rhynchospora pubera TaxID=906938 RepID=A0AAV8ECI5_9POAL|nr:F-box protein [Rhynchospora pubera]